MSVSVTGLVMGLVTCLVAGLVTGLVAGLATWLAVSATLSVDKCSPSLSVTSLATDSAGKCSLSSLVPVLVTGLV